jgi:hypothetical protein
VYEVSRAGSLRKADSHAAEGHEETMASFDRVCPAE